MGVDCIGFKLGFNWTGWRELYDLGVKFGWKPAGTHEDDKSGPSDDYFGNNFQIVTDPDAAAWATALYSALATETNMHPLFAAKIREFADKASKSGFEIG